MSYGGQADPWWGPGGDGDAWEWDTAGKAPFAEDRAQRLADRSADRPRHHYGGGAGVADGPHGYDGGAWGPMGGGDAGWGADEPAGRGGDWGRRNLASSSWETRPPGEGWASDEARWLQDGYRQYTKEGGGYTGLDTAAWGRGEEEGPPAQSEGQWESAAAASPVTFMKGYRARRGAWLEQYANGTPSGFEGDSDVWGSRRPKNDPSPSGGPASKLIDGRRVGPSGEPLTERQLAARQRRQQREREEAERLQRLVANFQARNAGFITDKFQPEESEEEEDPDPDWIERMPPDMELFPQEGVVVGDDEYDDEYDDDEGEEEEAGGPAPGLPDSGAFSTRVWRDAEGRLRAGWSHVLTAEEAQRWRVGDVVDEATIDRWFEADGEDEADVPAEEEVKLFGQGFSPYVYRDWEGHLCAGWGHRLTAAEREQWAEGDLVDDETLDRWFQDDRLDREPDEEDPLYGDDGPGPIFNDETFPLRPEELQVIRPTDDVVRSKGAVEVVHDFAVELQAEDDNDPEMYFDPECPPGWHVGVVTGWHDDQGFGFVMLAMNPQDVNNGKDLFVHESEVNKAWPEYYKTLVEGDMVEFKIERDDRGDINAKDVRALGGGPIVNEPPLTADPLIVRSKAQGEGWFRMLKQREERMHQRAKQKRIEALRREEEVAGHARSSLSF
eukprot:EG_transcript_3477